MKNDVAHSRLVEEVFAGSKPTTTPTLNIVENADNNILQVNMRGILSANAFFNFLNQCRLRKNIDRKSSAQISKEAAEMWLSMSPSKKLPFKRTAQAVKKFRAERARKRKGPYKIIGYQSYVTVDDKNRVKVKEMIAYTEPLKLKLNWNVVSSEYGRKAARNF